MGKIREGLLKVQYWRLGQKPCEHVEEIRDVDPSSDGCEECFRMGDSWIHLRMCLTCGHVACCDNSKNRHATAHFYGTGHPIIQSHEPGEDWRWCYEDRRII